MVRFKQHYLHISVKVNAGELLIYESLYEVPKDEVNQCELGFLGNSFALKELIRNNDGK